MDMQEIKADKEHEIDLRNQAIIVAKATVEALQAKVYRLVKSYHEMMMEWNSCALPNERIETAQQFLFAVRDELTPVKRAYEILNALLDAAEALVQAESELNDLLEI